MIYFPTRKHTHTSYIVLVYFPTTFVRERLLVCWMDGWLVAWLGFCFSRRTFIINQSSCSASNLSLFSAFTYLLTTHLTYDVFLPIPHTQPHQQQQLGLGRIPTYIYKYSPYAFLTNGLYGYILSGYLPMHLYTFIYIPIQDGRRNWNTRGKRDFFLISFIFLVVAGCGIFDIQAHRGKGVTCSFFSSYLLSDSPSLSVFSQAYILSFGSSYRMVKIYISVVRFSHCCCVEFSTLSSYRSVVVYTYTYIAL